MTKGGRAIGKTKDQWS